MIASTEETKDPNKKSPSYGRSPEGPSGGRTIEKEMVDVSMSGGGGGTDYGDGGGGVAR